MIPATQIFQFGYIFGCLLVEIDSSRCTGFPSLSVLFSLRQIKDIIPAKANASRCSFQRGIMTQMRNSIITIFQAGQGFSCRLGFCSCGLGLCHFAWIRFSRLVLGSKFVGVESISSDQQRQTVGCLAMRPCQRSAEVDSLTALAFTLGLKPSFLPSKLIQTFCPGLNETFCSSLLRRIVIVGPGLKNERTCFNIPSFVLCNLHILIFRDDWERLFSLQSLPATPVSYNCYCFLCFRTMAWILFQFYVSRNAPKKQRILARAQTKEGKTN